MRKSKPESESFLRHLLQLGHRECVGALSALCILCSVLYLVGTFERIGFNQTLLANLKVHIAGIGIILGVLLVLIRAPVRGIGFMLLAAIGMLVPIHTLKSVPVVEASVNMPQLDIISFNILHYNKQGIDVLEFLQKSQADIIVLAEAEPLRVYQEALKEVYPYTVGCGDEICELVILSRHPFVRAEQRPFPWGANRLSMATINFHDQNVRIIATHLTKSFFSDLRTRELSHVVRAIREEDTPYILAGDFNAALWAPELKRIISSTDSYAIDKIIGTWPVKMGKYGIPIDHIILSKGLMPVSYTPLPSSFGSNHRGVRALVTFDPRHDTESRVHY